MRLSHVLTQMHNHGSHSLAKTLDSEPLTDLVMLNRTNTQNQNLCHHVLNLITCIPLVELNPGQSEPALIGEKDWTGLEPTSTFITHFACYHVDVSCIPVQVFLG